MMPKDTAAHSQDHQTVPAEERFKGNLVALLDEAPQKLPVTQEGSLADQFSLVDVVKELADRAGRHLPPLRLALLLFLSISRSGAVTDGFFGKAGRETLGGVRRFGAG
jgi:hypothetical protein